MARKGNPISVRNYQSIFLDILVYIIFLSISLTFINLGIPIILWLFVTPGRTTNRGFALILQQRVPQMPNSIWT